MRLHLFEFEDQPWFPDLIRNGGTDYLRFIFKLLNYYTPAIPVLRELLQATGEKQILDLCSGGGGPIEQVSKQLGSGVRCVLSDKYPNVSAFEELKRRTRGAVDYLPESIDILKPPGALAGVRTTFSALHHFRPAQVVTILERIMDSGRPLAFFDSGDRHPGTLLGIVLVHPILFFLCTPFFNPFRWSRIVFTYFIPLIPLYTIWDGVVSVFRLHRARDLQKLTGLADPAQQYAWKCGVLKHPLGFRLTYLTGRPVV